MLGWQAGRSCIGMGRHVREGMPQGRQGKQPLQVSKGMCCQEKWLGTGKREQKVEESRRDPDDVEVIIVDMIETEG